MLNSGPHGSSEVLYAFTSAANNNGSAFAGLSVNTDWYNTALGWRWCSTLPSHRAGPRPSRVLWPVRAHTGLDRNASTHRPQFVGMVAGVTLILVALTFLLMLALALAEGIH